VPVYVLNVSFMSFTSYNAISLDGQTPRSHCKSTFKEEDERTFRSVAFSLMTYFEQVILSNGLFSTGSSPDMTQIIQSAISARLAQ